MRFRVVWEIEVEVDKPLDAVPRALELREGAGITRVELLPEPPAHVVLPRVVAAND